MKITELTSLNRIGVAKNFTAIWSCLLILVDSGFTAEEDEREQNTPITSDTEDPNEELKFQLNQVQQKVSLWLIF